MEREFSKEELEQAKRLSYENWEKTDTELGFEFCGQWITNPFVEISGRFEFADITAMCEFYSKENVYNFISNILSGNKGDMMKKIKTVVKNMHQIGKTMKSFY